MALVPTYCSNCRDETETGADLCSSCAQEALSGALAAMNYHTLRAQVGEGPWEVSEVWDELGVWECQLRSDGDPQQLITLTRGIGPAAELQARAAALCKLLNGEA